LCLCLLVYQLWGHPHCSSLSSSPPYSTTHTLSLSITPVSTHSSKPSAASHHGTSTRVFILLATPTKSAGQVEPRQVCIKRPRFQPEIIQRLHQEEGTSGSTNQPQPQEGLASCNISKDRSAVLSANISPPTRLVTAMYPAHDLLRISPSTATADWTVLPPAWLPHRALSTELSRSKEPRSEPRLSILKTISNNRTVQAQNKNK